LELVKIIPVDDHDLVMFVGKTPGQVNACKTGADDDNPGVFGFGDVDGHGSGKLREGIRGVKDQKNNFSICLNTNRYKGLRLKERGKG
jgi:hypothetical protein